MRPAIYTASKTKHAAKWRKLRADGVNVISTWIDEAESGQTIDFKDLWRRCVTEAAKCDALLLYVENGEELKGALVEVGAALAMGTPVFLVGQPGASGTWPAHELVHPCETVEQVLTAITKYWEGPECT